MKELLYEIIEKAALLGLPDTDISTANEFLDHHEFGLCLDTIITQMYENEVHIDFDFYNMVVAAAKKMEISIGDISFIKKLLL